MISACHSSHLAQVLIDSGVPVVVSISASVQVLEEAAEKFNREFMLYLLKGLTPKVAFQHGQSVLASESTTSGICCCNHDHTADCLWIKYKEASNDYDAHMVHIARCKCALKKGYGPIDHELGCTAYK